MANTITLTAYNMGLEATEADFDAWHCFVTCEIGALFEEPVIVEQHPFSNGPASDTYELGDDPDGERSETMRACLEELWELWCEVERPAFEEVARRFEEMDGGK